MSSESEYLTDDVSTTDDANELSLLHDGHSLDVVEEQVSTNIDNALGCVERLRTPDLGGI
jgi:hypothetical protein